MAVYSAKYKRPKGTHARHIGNISEAAVMLALISLGVDVARPIGELQRYDFLCDVNDRLFRVQVKTAIEIQNSAIFVPLASTQRVGSKQPYHGQVDVVLAYCHETREIFAVDGDVLKQKSITLRRTDKPKGVAATVWHRIKVLEDWVQEVKAA